MNWLSSLLALVFQKILAWGGEAIYKWVLEYIEKIKRATTQKKAADQLQKDTDNNVSREERKKDEGDYLNS